MGRAGAAHELKMETQFPFKPDVALTLTTPAPAAMKLRVRIPTWAARDMEISVNGTPAITGRPGTYVTLDRTWATGDKITFTLPMEFRITRYTGVDKVPDHPTYGLEYGPILYAMVADKDFRLTTDGPDAESLLKQLVPSPTTRSTSPSPTTTATNSSPTGRSSNSASPASPSSTPPNPSPGGSDSVPTHSLPLGSRRPPGDGLGS